MHGIRRIPSRMLVLPQFDLMNFVTFVFLKPTVNNVSNMKPSSSPPRFRFLVFSGDKPLPRNSATAGPARPGFTESTKFQRGRKLMVRKGAVCFLQPLLISWSQCLCSESTSSIGSGMFGAQCHRAIPPLFMPKAHRPRKRPKHMCFQWVKPRPSCSTTNVWALLCMLDLAPSIEKAQKMWPNGPSTEFRQSCH